MNYSTALLLTCSVVVVCLSFGYTWYSTVLLGDFTLTNTEPPSEETL